MHIASSRVPLDANTPKTKQKGRKDSLRNNTAAMSPTTLHQGATKGFADAATYDAYRPSYPPGATQRFLSHLRLADVPHARVLDLAAGTGKMTEVLAARHEGFEVVAVEPHEGMRAELERKGLSGVEVKDGFASRLPLDEEWGDGAIVAQVSFCLLSVLGLEPTSKAGGDL